MINKEKQILVLTGKRGGFGAIKPMLKKIEKNKNFNLHLVATDQHLNPKFGKTIKEINKSFKKVYKIKINNQDGTQIKRSYALALFFKLFSRLLRKIKPDLCVLYGDRSEVMVASTCCVNFNVPIAHLQGGDITGSIDDYFRHAITKLSNLHLVSNNEARKNLLSLREKRQNIIVTGDHHIDNLLSEKIYSKKQLYNFIKLKINTPYIIILQHSETTQIQNAYSQMEKTMKACSKFDIPKIVIYPSTDPGWQNIVRSIKNYSQDKNFLIFKNLDTNIFISLLKYSKILVGNSSCGIIESSYFSIPTINIGRRQEGRLKDKNVFNLDHDINKIYNKIKSILSNYNNLKKKFKCKRLYGNGKAADKSLKAFLDFLKKKDKIKRFK